MRPRPLCVLALSSIGNLIDCHHNQENSTKIDQQSGPLCAISEHVLFTHATSHACCAMHMLSQRHERKSFLLQTHEQLALVQSQ